MPLALGEAGARAYAYASERSFGGDVRRTATLVVLALLAAISLSGCGSADDDADQGSHSSHSPGQMTRDNKGVVRKGG